jgi:hypothetical protein
MTLQEFLINKELTAVEVLPDNRLINVVISSGELYGIHVDNIPSNVVVTRLSSNVVVTRLSPVTLENDIIYVDNLSFDTTQYTMLSV